MKLFRNAVPAALLSFAGILAGAAPADAILLDPTERGSYRGDINIFGTGGAGTAIGNFQTGINGPELRSFFNFDLSGISETVTAATFSINLIGTFGSGAPGSTTFGLAPITTETISIFDVTTDIDALVTNGGGAAAFADLGDGFSYGSASVSTDAVSGTLDFVFDATGLANVNAAAGGNFALGGALTSIDGGQGFEFLFGDSQDVQSTTHLNLQVRTDPVPEPSVYGVLAVGLVGIAALRRRRHVI